MDDCQLAEDYPTRAGKFKETDRITIEKRRHAICLVITDLSSAENSHKILYGLLKKHVTKLQIAKAAT